ncbi:MAG: Trm112 family protein [Candidatus Heimdallarchaeota archaeon]
MKTWLFDVLACPIDKHFPLELYIFSYANKIGDFESFLNVYKQRDLEVIKKDSIIKIYKEGEIVYISDGIVLEKTPFDRYIELLLSSINELNYINDQSKDKISGLCFNLIKNEIREKLIEFLKNFAAKKVENLIPEFFFVNKIKLEVEINSGLLLCPKCKRWYPIIDTIPQMLPDEFRNRTKELEFLKTNKNLLNDEFFKQDLRPFNI